MNIKKVLLCICVFYSLNLSLNAQVKVERNKYFKEITKENLKDFSQLEKGMSFQDFETKYKINILTTLYDKTKAESKQVKIMFMSRRIINLNVIEVLSFIFIEDKLTAWGNIDDLKRNKNKDIQDVINTASKKLYIGDMYYD